MHALFLTLLLTMSLFSSLKTIVQKMSLAAWSQAWQRGDEEISGGSGAGLVQPYAGSVWVQRAIKKVAEPISAVPLEFYGPDSETEIKDPALSAFWRSPAIDRSGPMGRADFLMASVGWWKLCGEFFWLLGDDWLVSRRPGSPILIARPDRMRPILEDNRLVAWEFTDASGKRHILLREQVIHKKAWNPYDDLRGLSEYESAKIAAQSDYAAGRFALNLNAANGDRGVIVVAKSGMPTDAQQLQITEALRAKTAAARRGAFRPIFLTGDVAIEDPKVSAPDANFVAARLNNRHEIALAFGVPPSMFDVKASYSVGAASDRYMLIVDTCMPMGEKIEDAIEEVSARLLGGREVEAWLDWDDHDVMQQARRERLAGVSQLWSVGVPMEQVNEALSLGLKPFAGWEKSYLPFSVSEAGAEEKLPTADQPPALPAGEEEAEPDRIEAMIRLVAAAADPIESMQRVLLIDDTPPALPLGARALPHVCSLPADLTEKAGDNKRTKLWKAHMRARRSAVKRYATKFSKVLMTARAEVLRKIASQGTGRCRATAPVAEAGGAPALQTRAAALDFLFDLEKFGAALKGEMRKAAQATLLEGGAQLFAEIGNDDPYTMPPARAVEFLDQRENRLSDVADDVFARIKSSLQDGLDAGDSTAELAARIKSEFNAIDDGRAEVIAQTEVSAAYGYSRQDAMDQAGVEWKEWLTSGLDTVRATHLEAEGQRVAINDQFEVPPGSKTFLFYPGDPSGPPEEVINCHCVSIAVSGPEETNT